MRSRWLLLPTLLLLVSALPRLLEVLTDAWWFASIGHAPTFQDQLLAAAGAFLTGALVFGGWFGLQTTLAVRTTRAEGLPQAPTWVAAGAALLALAGGSWAAARWTLWLPALSPVEFGFVEPVYEGDASFYALQLEAARAVRDAAALLAFLTLLATAGLYLARSGVRVRLEERQGQVLATGLAIDPNVRTHLAVLLGVQLVLLGNDRWLDRYDALSLAGPLLTGPGYASLATTLPLQALAALLTACAAIPTWIGLTRLKPGPVFLAVALVALPPLAVGVVPSVVQALVVDPAQLTRETPHLQEHLRATRFAWDLDQVEVVPLEGAGQLRVEDLPEHAGTLHNVRLWDDEPLLAAFAQVQEIRTYYRFGAVDTDRYRLGGELRQVMLSPRELAADELPAAARTWVNEHLTYTHGYGLALGPVDQVTPEGLPELFLKDLPPRWTYPELRVDRPEIYFGEGTDRWILTGGRPDELDYPAGEDNTWNRYDGADGLPLDGLRRLVFALHLRSSELLFSAEVLPGSRLHLYRTVSERLQRLAPFLRWDSDPYLVILNGRLVWVVDGYTESDRFPYARALVDSAGRPGVNYRRNPVKATVDAYDGRPVLYLIDPTEPIAATWAQRLPDLFQPASALPAGLQEHLRYPVELFDAQSSLYATFHMKEVQAFYNREDEWEVPRLGEDQPVPPAAAVLRLPGEDEAEFVQMRPLTPRSKSNLAAWMVARSDPAHYGGLRVYTWPKSRLFYGPNMVAARIQQDEEISARISLWNQKGSTVRLGELLVLPLGDALLYVQPLYLRAQSGSIPELKRVIVALEGRIAMAPTLDEALAQVLTTTPPTEAAPPPPAPPTGARALWEEAREALRRADWAGFGRAFDALGDSLRPTEPPEDR